MFPLAIPPRDQGPLLAVIVVALALVLLAAFCPDPSPRAHVDRIVVSP
jgi:hypothetical protein